jgi:hypothetical protein
MNASQVQSDPLLRLIKEAYPLVKFDIADVPTGLGVSSPAGICRIRMSCTMFNGSGSRAVIQPELGRQVNWWGARGSCELLTEMASRNAPEPYPDPQPESWVPVSWQKWFPMLHNYFRAPTAIEAFDAALGKRNFPPNTALKRVRNWWRARMKRPFPNPRWGWTP